MMKRRPLVCVGVFLAMAATRPATAEAPRHVRVTWRGDASTSAIVSWTTDGVTGEHSLRYRQKSDAAGGPDAGDAVASDWRQTACHRGVRLDGEGSVALHHARLTGLAPATAYELVAISGGERSSPKWFRTAPADDRPVQLISGGDSRSGWEHRRKMNGLVQRLVAEADAAGRPPVVAFAHGGDFVNKGADARQWRQWLSDNELLTGDDGRLLPLIPTRGNHDFGPLFNRVFDFPDGDLNYYATRITPAVCLLTLNTETSSVGDQRGWLAEELAAIGPETRWLLCQYHKPAFPAVKVPSGALRNWVPLFDRYGVDLCLESDGHCIKRTAPIRGQKLDPAGVVYIGEGGLGVGQRSPKTSRWYLQPPAVTGRGHHVHLLTFAQDRLAGRVILEDGSVFDEFSLAPRRRTPLSEPRR